MAATADLLPAVQECDQSWRATRSQQYAGGIRDVLTRTRATACSAVHTAACAADVARLDVDDHADSSLCCARLGVRYPIPRR